MTLRWQRRDLNSSRSSQWFSSRGHWATSGDILGCRDPGLEVLTPGIQKVGAKPPAVHRTGPHNGESSAPKVHGN